MHPRSWLALVSLPVVGTFSLPVLQPQSAKPKASVSADPLAGLTDIQDVLQMVQQNYVDAPDMERVLGGGIQAVLERAHPLNSLLSPEDLRLPDPGPAEAGFRWVKRGAGGLYAQVTVVFPGSPAAEAGLQAGDVVRKVDGDSVGNLSAFHLERRLRGAEGSTLVISKVTPTGEMAKVSVGRKVLAPRSIDFQAGPGTLRAALPDLKAGRAEELRKALEGRNRGDLLVLDLRSTEGGTPEEAAAVAALFAPGSPFATLQEAGKSDQAKQVPGGPGLGFGKVAVLQGPSTQGPAEVLAACLKKAGKRVVGDRTLGLAVQRTRAILRQGGAVEIVSARWMGAGGEKLDRQGVVPTETVRPLRPEEDPLPRLMEAAGRDATAKAK